MTRCLVWSFAVLLALALGDTAQLTAQVQLASRAPHFVRVSPVTRGLVDASHATILKREVSLRLDRSSLAGALDEISRTAGIKLIYSRDLVPLETPVTLEAATITLGAALTAVLFDTGLDVVISSNGEMALMKKAPVSPLSQAQTGSISGRVTDVKTSAVIAGATVLIERASLSATTDNDGRYRIAEVVPGTYSLRARYIGYAPGMVSVAVSADQEATADFALEKSVQRLDEVVTTGTVVPTEVKALPTPITVITADEIAQRHPQVLTDVFRQATPTAVAFDNPASPLPTRFSARGVSSLSGSSPMKIFVDGVEASNLTLDPVDPRSIERIEVVRGPQASTLYGSDAAGGVIQIFTKKGDPSLSRPQVEGQAALGVAQTPYSGFGGVLRQEYTGSVRGGGQDVGYNFGGGYTRLADWVPPNGARSSQTSPSIYGGMRFARDIITAELSARYYRNRLPPATNPLLLTTGFVPNSQPSYQNNDFTNETYGGRVTVSPTSWWRNQVTLGVDRSGQQNVQTQRRFTTPADTLYALFVSNARKISLGYNTSVSAQFTKHLAGSLTVGADHYDQEASFSFTNRALNTEGTIATSPAGSFTENRTTITNSGYFAQAQVNWRDALFLTAGLRAEENSTFGQDLGTPVLPRLGLSFVQRVGQTTAKLRGSYGKAIRAASPGQAFGAVLATQINLANPLLGPERQRGWDAGIDLAFGDRGSLSVTGYDQTAEDLIVFVQVATTPLPTFQFQNIGRVVNRGIEIEQTLNFRSLQLTAQYGYVHSRIEDLGPSVSPGAALLVGDRPEATPTHTAGAALTLTPWGGTTLGAGLTYVGSYRRQDVVALLRCLGGTGPCQATSRGYIVPMPGFAKANVTFTQRVARQLEAFVSIDNLTNNQAYEGSNGIPVIGRTTMAGLHVTY